MDIVFFVFNILLFVVPISAVAYMLWLMRRNKNRSFEVLGEQDEADVEQIFVQHKGESIPIFRRELPMWSKMRSEDRSALVATFRNAVKKGKMQKTDKGYTKKVKIQSGYSI
jgi:hypothetical protein